MTNQDNTPLRIVHATEAMGGGVQSAIAAYARLLGDSQQFVLGRPRSQEATYTLPEHAELRTFEGSLPAYLLWVRRMVIEIRPDVVHLHSSLAGLARTVLPRGTRIVYSPHCFAFERTDVSALQRSAYRLAERALAVRKQTFVAVSPHEAELCLALAPRGRGRVEYVPNVASEGSIREPFGNPAATAPAADANTGARAGTVVMTGRIGPQKLPRLYADAAELSSSDAEFVWIGDGDTEDRAYLESRGVRVTGWLTPSDVVDTVSSAELYLHTGAWEAAPISIVEAATAGTPVLTRSLPTLQSLGYADAGIDAASVAASVDRYFADEPFRAGVAAQTHAAISRASVDDARESLLRAYGSPISATNERARAQR
ncbi:glycosyltransferase [Plantibacter sp. YIM 135249]|uniref:glycosyltransferase n=1 Tax=Plantibacter sp. YIM 135249 TaxID=3423918 RepID=UPI003D34A799